MSRYRIKEVFSTVQGEGAFAGTAAVFIRLVGCNMWSGYEKDRVADAERNGAQCPLWCDTDFTKEGSAFYSPLGVLALVENQAGDGIKHVVITGGEPLLQLDKELVGTLRDAGFFVAVETNGTVSLKKCRGDLPNWITCSPKTPVDRIVIERISELKLVLPDYHPEDYVALQTRMSMYPSPTGRRRYLYVQCEDGPVFEVAVRQAVAWVSENPDWKISVQGHKALQLP